MAAAVKQIVVLPHRYKVRLNVVERWSPLPLLDRGMHNRRPIPLDAHCLAPPLDPLERAHLITEERRWVNHWEYVRALAPHTISTFFITWRIISISSIACDACRLISE